MNKHTVKRVVLLSFSLIHLVFWSMAYSSIQHEVNETRSAKIITDKSVGRVHFNEKGGAV